MNFSLNDPGLQTILIAILPIVVRLAALVMTLPMISGKVVSFRMRLGLVFALTFLVAPSVMQIDPSVSSIHPWKIAIGLVNEVLLGAMMGLALNVIVASAQLVGAIIESSSGLAMSSFGVPPDPETGQGVYAKLFWWTSAAVFIAAGGLGLAVGGVLDSFRAIPTGSAMFDQSFVDFFVVAIGKSFQFALSAAIPALAALLIASVVLGMAQRNFPQLGGMQVGLGIKAIFGMLVASAVLVSAPWVLFGGFEMTMEQLHFWLQNRSTMAAG